MSKKHIKRAACEPCGRCGRVGCRATELGEKAIRLKFPLSLKAEVMAAQDECAAIEAARKRPN